MDEEKPVEDEQPLVDGQHARVVGEEALDVDVELEALEAVGDKRLVHGLHHVRVVGVDGPERNPIGHGPRGGVEPGVDLPGHTGLVGVGEVDEALDAVVAEEARDQLGLRRVLERPIRALGEPSPDRTGKPRRMEVGVDVDIPEVLGRPHQALTTQVPGQPLTETPARTRPALARRSTVRAVSTVSSPKSLAMRMGVEYTAPSR